MPPHIPQEIIDDILDYLAYDEDSLLASALVCHAFVPRSQLHLFRKVELSSYDPPPRTDDGDERVTRAQRVEKLSEILRGSPLLANHIRELKIQLSSANEENSWLWTDDMFLDIMSSLDSLTSLELSSGDYLTTCGFVNTDKLERAFWTPYIAPRVTHLAFDYVTTLSLGLFANLPKLIHLQLSDSSVIPAPLDRPFFPTAPLQLDSLELDGAHAAFDLLDTWKSSTIAEFLDLKQLRIFKCFARQRAPEIERVLKRAKYSLKKLRIRSAIVDPSKGGVFVLEELPLLRSFQLSTIVYEIIRLSQLNVNALVGIAKILDTAGPDHKIRKIKINVAAWSREDIDPEAGDEPVRWLDTRTWQAFDNAVTKFQRKTSEPLDLKIHLSAPTDRPIYTEKVMEGFPRICIPLILANEHIRIHYTYHI